MAETKKEFKGFRQVTSEYFNSLSKEEKDGKVFFVRNLDENNDVTSSHVYFGEREYGEQKDVIDCGEY